MCGSCKHMGWDEVDVCARSDVCMLPTKTAEATPVGHSFCSHDGRGGVRTDAVCDKSIERSDAHAEKWVEYRIGGVAQAGGVKKCKEGSVREKNRWCKRWCTKRRSMKQTVQAHHHHEENNRPECPGYPNKSPIQLFNAWNKHLDLLFARKTLQYG